MAYKRDEAKRLANIRKHGTDFVECESIFDDFTVTVEDNRFVDGEQRFCNVRFVGKDSRSDPHHLDTKSKQT